MKFSKRSRERLQGVEEELAELMEEAIKESPIDFMIVDGLRTKEQQMELYAQGRTKPGKIVTKVDGVKRLSKHQTGKAVDICPWVNGKLDWNDPEKFKTIANHIKNVAEELAIDVIWGGDWKGSWDKPHFELV